MTERKSPSAAPTTSAVADVAAVGVEDDAPAAADHRHGREAFATVAELADVAAAEGAGADVTVPRGGHIHAHGSGYLPNAHHAQSHVLADGAALGPDHTISGAAAGEVLRALTATTAAFDQLSHADLGGVTSGQHHTQAHDHSLAADTTALVPESVEISGGPFALRGDISPASLAASVNDYNPTGLADATVLRLTSSAAVNITGLAGGADGRQLVIVNIGANTITLTDEDVASLAANRFALGGNSPLAADEGLILLYDSTSSRWRIVGHAEDTAGGGGAHDHTAADGSGVLTNDEHDGYSEYADIASPTAAAANKLRLFSKDAGGRSKPHYKDDALGDVLLTGVIDRATADNDIVNTTTETQLYGFSVPANALGTSGLLRMSIWGDYLNNSGAGATYTLRIKFGGTIIYEDATGSIGAAAARHAFYFLIEVGNKGATNVQFLVARYNLSVAGTATTGVGDLATAGATGELGAKLLSSAGDSALDTTVAQTLEVTIAHSVANANVSIRRKYAYLELL